MNSIIHSLFFTVFFITATVSKPLNWFESTRHWIAGKKDWVVGQYYCRFPDSHFSTRDNYEIDFLVENLHRAIKANDPFSNEELHKALKSRSGALFLLKEASAARNTEALKEILNDRLVIKAFCVDYDFITIRKQALFDAAGQSRHPQALETVKILLGHYTAFNTPKIILNPLEEKKLKEIAKSEIKKIESELATTTKNSCNSSPDTIRITTLKSDLAKAKAMFNFFQTVQK